MKQFTILFFALLCTIEASAGVLPPVNIPEYVFSQEMLDARVTSLSEDTDGFLWIGTYRGLVKYSGGRFKTYLSTPSSNLGSDNIHSLLSGKDGKLWVGTDQGVYFVDREGSVDVSRADLRIVGAMGEYDGNYILAANAEGVSIIDIANNESFPVIPDRHLGRSRQIVKTITGNYVLLDYYGTKITFVSDKFATLAAVSPSASINKIEVFRDMLLAATSNGIYAFDGNGTPIRLPEAFRHTEGKNVAFIEAGDNVLYYGITDDGIYRFSHGDAFARKISLEENLNNVFDAVTHLSAENLWISKNGIGVEKIPVNHSYKDIQLPGITKSDRIYGFFPGEGRNFFLKSRQKLFYFSDTLKECFDVTPAFVGERKESIEVLDIDKSGNVYMLAGKHAYKFRFDGKAFHQLLEAELEAPRFLWCNDSETIIIDAKELVTIRENGEIVRKFFPKGFSDAFSGQRLSTGEVLFTDGTTFYSYAKDGQFIKVNLPREIGMMLSYSGSIDASRAGEIWAGSFNDGVWAYDRVSGQLEHYSVGTGLPDKAISQIEVDPEDNVWLTFRGVIMKISGEDGQTTLFETPNKGKNNIYAGVSIARTYKGRIYFGGNGYITEFIPETATSSIKKPFLDGILVNDQVISAPKDGMVLKNNQNKLVFYYSSPAYESTSAVNYLYRLSGYDKAWTNAHQSTNAAYSNLKPGKYVFQVKVLGEGGYGNDEMFSFPFRIKPALFLSPFFIFLYVILALAAMTFGIVLYLRNKINHERLQFVEQEREMSRQLNKEKTEFFSNISHEFRTPLTLIYGPAKELAGMDSLDGKERKLAGLIEKNAEHLLSLSDQLINFNRLSRNPVNLQVSKQDIGRILEDAASNFDHLIDERDLELETDIEKPLYVWCDIEKVEKIFFNLLSNAVKYTPEGGKIHVTALKDDQGCRISVSDTGIGIPESKIADIFNRYERLKAKVGEGDVPEGFGIGLNYAILLAKLHKGELSVRSKENEGSTFIFSFPSEKSAYSSREIWEGNANEELSAMQKTIPYVEDNEPHKNEYTILVVEDDEDMRDYLKGFLEEKYNIILAHDGDEAMNYLAMTVPDLIISDVMMPYKDGLTLCKEIKLNPEYCHLPILLMTAKTGTETHLKGLEAGADAYIRKPFDPRYLYAVVANLLENRRKLQARLRDLVGNDAPDEQEEIQMNSHDKAFLEKLQTLMNEHLGENDFNVAYLYNEMAMSRTSFYSKVKSLLGESPKTFLADFRLNKAMQLLKTHDYNVSEVCDMVGFGTLAGFSRSFKNKFGVPPSSI